MNHLIKILGKFFTNIWNSWTDPDPKYDSSKRIWFIVLIITVFILGINTVFRASQGYGSQYDDFTAFSKELIFDRINVYKEYSFDRTSIGKYPPFFAFVYAPVAWMPLQIGAAIWFALGITMLITATKLLAKMSMNFACISNNNFKNRLWAVPIITVITVVMANLSTSQVNIFIFSLVAFGLYQFSKRNDKWAGLFIGIASAIKLTPGLFVVYFAYKGAWKTVLWAAIGGVICWGVLLPLALGPGRYFEIMTSWYGILSGYLTEGTLAESLAGFKHTNQSLSAFIFRYFTETPAGGGIENFYINVASLPYDVATHIVDGLKILLVLLLGFVCRTPVKNRNDFRLGIEFSLIMMATLFISPISWINHYVVMVLPFSVGVFYIWQADPKDANRKWMLKWLIISSILVVVSPKISQAFSLPFLGALIFFIVLVKSIYRMKPVASRVHLNH